MARWSAPLLAVSCAWAQTTSFAPPAPPPAPSPEVGAPPHALRIEPYLTLVQTLSDRSGAGAGSGSWITQIQPGVRMSSERGQLRGHIDYGLDGLVLGNGTGSSKVRHRLDADGRAELLDKRFTIDASARVAQQTISPFGLQTPDVAIPNDNQAQVFSLRLAPELHGTLFGEVDYVARLFQSTQRAQGTRAFDSDITSASLALSGGTPLRAVSWSVRGGADVYDFATSRKSQARHTRAQLTYAPWPSLQLSLIGGREVNDIRTADMQGHDIVGWAADWRPSVRTRLFAQQESRFFGTGYNVLAEHRTARTTWRLSDRRDISAPQDERTLAAIGTAFDLFFQQFASIEPDPVQRQILVSNYLLTNGIDPNTPIFAGFLTSAVTLTRDQQASFAWNGLRDTFTVSWFQTWTRRASALASAPDDFTNTALVHQKGLSASLDHRLTPQQTVNLLLLFTRSTGSLATMEAELRSLQATWSTQVNPKTTISLGARHSEFDNPTQSYTENALIGILTMRF